MLSVLSRKDLILFLGPDRGGLHLMAEGIVGARAGDTVQVVSASRQAAPPQALAIQVMQEIGIDISALSARTLSDAEVFSFDLVVTLGEPDAPDRPDLPGMPPHLHWDFSTPDFGLPQAQLLSGLQRYAGKDGQKSSTGAQRAPDLGAVKGCYDEVARLWIIVVLSTAEVELNGRFGRVLDGELQRHVFAQRRRRRCFQAQLQGVCQGRHQALESFQRRQRHKSNAVDKGERLLVGQYRCPASPRRVRRTASRS